MRILTQRNRGARTACLLLALVSHVGGARAAKVVARKQDLATVQTVLDKVLELWLGRLPAKRRAVVEQRLNRNLKEMQPHVPGQWLDHVHHLIQSQIDKPVHDLSYPPKNEFGMIFSADPLWFIVPLQNAKTLDLDRNANQMIASDFGDRRFMIQVGRGWHEVTLHGNTIAVERQKPSQTEEPFPTWRSIYNPFTKELTVDPIYPIEGLVNRSKRWVKSVSDRFRHLQLKLADASTGVEASALEKVNELIQELASNHQPLTLAARRRAVDFLTELEKVLAVPGNGVSPHKTNYEVSFPDGAKLVVALGDRARGITIITRDGARRRYLLLHADAYGKANDLDASSSIGLGHDDPAQAGTTLEIPEGEEKALMRALEQTHERLLAGLDEKARNQLEQDERETDARLKRMFAMRSAFLSQTAYFEHKPAGSDVVHWYSVGQKLRYGRMPDALAKKQWRE